jgi:hypothetical protein
MLDEIYDELNVPDFVVTMLFPEFSTLRERVLEALDTYSNEAGVYYYSVSATLTCARIAPGPANDLIVTIRIERGKALDALMNIVSHALSDMHSEQDWPPAQLRIVGSFLRNLKKEAAKSVLEVMVDYVG